MQDVQFPPQDASGSEGARAAYKNAVRIASLVHAISLEDGEFVLKLALYVRRDLNIRHTAAVLVALSAFEPKCQPFLKCYMRRIICLPSDWLSIANIAVEQPHLRLSPLPAAAITTSDDATFTTSDVRGLNGGSERGPLPNALRRALVSTFTMFDNHSLAKYNTERATKRKCKKMRMKESVQDPKSPRPLTFKDHIRRLHISQPAYAVCCLLGKRYPDTEEEFRERGLDEGGTRAFDPKLRGRRMRLPIPITWERQLSLRGNRSEVWDELIANNNVPFMAMLRNLRNMAWCNCSESTHVSVIRRLVSEEQVVASRQFPYRFLSAYNALKISLGEKYHKYFHVLQTKKKSRGYFTDNVTRSRLLERYKDALDQAVRISVRGNITPIRGASLVVLYLSPHFEFDDFRGSSQLGKAILLAVAFRYACEHCVVLLAGKDRCGVMELDLRREDGMLHNVEKVKDICRKMSRCGTFSTEDKTQFTQLSGFPYVYLDDMLERRVNLQSLVVMGFSHSCYSGQNDAPSLGDLPVYLERMRRTCNEDLLFLSLQASLEEDEAVSSRYRHKNDVLLTGFSDAMLRFVAERVAGGPRRYVERADEVYDVHRVAVLPGCMPGGELHALRRVLSIEQERRVYKGGATTETLSEGGLTDTQKSSAMGLAKTPSPPSLPLPLLQLPTMMPEAATHDTACTTATTAETPIRWPQPERGFLSAYQECRFFLSSTFIDMNSERNALVLDVFPRLRRWAAEAGLRVNIVEVDLRWGITEEASSSNLSLSVCLNEVSRCSPFFLGVLGSRYGYCPPTLYHRVDEDVDAEDFTWLKQLPQDNPARMSVTEMEMRHAVFTAARRTGESVPRTMVFFVRDHSALMSSLAVEDREAYAPDTPTTMQSLSKLSGYLEAQGVPMFSYTATGIRSGSDALSAISMLSIKKSALHVPLDVTNFSRKAFVALKSIILQRCGLPDDAGESLQSQRDHANPKQQLKPQPKHQGDDILKQASTGGALYAEEYMDQVSFTTNLLKTFVPPLGLLEKLSFFALTGHLPTDTSSSTAGGVAAESSIANVTLSHDSRDQNKASNVLLLQGSDGNGLSSVAAAVAAHIAYLEESNLAVLHFACQASDGSLRRLVYYLAFSLVHRLRLQEDFCVRESDSVTTLLPLLPGVYAAAMKKKHLCIILDGLDKSSFAPEILRNLGWIVPRSTGPEIRFLITTTLSSSFATALKSRVQPVVSLMLPDLSLSERAELVRRHLASYGKRLQESFCVNELKLLLRKTDANQASYLTYAITYLRLFSFFDTLRADIASLPSTLPQLHAETYKKLEEQFGVETCRAVLVSLYLSQSLSGLKEYNLHRLVSNVASASRLVALLVGTCLRVTRKRVLIANASFEASIAARYLPHSSDVVDACTNRLVAELYFRPLATSVSRYETRESIRLAVDSIKHSPREKCVFSPHRYTTSQLLALLHFALLAKEYDALATLAAYVPFIEYLLVNATYLQRFMNLLSQATMANSMLSRRLYPIIEFLQSEYHILVDRPSLLRQCIRNLPSCSAIFHGLDHNHGDRGGDGEVDDMDSNIIRGKRNPMTWVRWMNPSQHGEEGRIIKFPSTEPLHCLVLSDDGKFMAAGGEDMMVRVMPQGALEQITASLKHTAPVTAIAFLPNHSHILLTGCGRGVLRVWSLEDNSLLQQSQAGHTRCISSLACHPTRSVVCSGSHDGLCAIWNVVSSVAESVARSSVQPSQILKHHTAPVSCVAYHSSGEILATGSWEGCAYFINMERPMDDTSRSAAPLEYVHQFLDAQSPVRGLAFLPSMVVTCAVALYSGDICLYDYASASCSARLTLHAGIPITSLAFSPDAALMASANENGNVHVAYAGVTGTVMSTLNGHRQAVTSVVFHQQNPSILFTSSVDNSLKEWYIGQSSERRHTGLRGTHTMSVTACAAASDGSFFVTGGMDGTAFVFASHQVVGGDAFENPGIKDDFFVPHFILSHEHNRVSCIRVVMQNSRILCGTAAGEVFVWAASPGLNLREGRLLQRIRVVGKGTYPVIFIACEEEHVADVSKGCPVDALDVSKPHGPLRGRATALTTDGAIAAWEMCDDDGLMLALEGKPLHEALHSDGGVMSNNAYAVGSQPMPAPSEHIFDVDPAVRRDGNHVETTIYTFSGHADSGTQQYFSSSQESFYSELSERAPQRRESSGDSNVVGGTLKGAPQRAVLRWVTQAECLWGDEEEQQVVSCEPSPSNGSALATVPSDAEEIVAAVSFINRRQSNQSGLNSSSKSTGTEAAAADARHHTGLLCGHYIVVGRLRCHLALATLQRVITLPMHNPLQLQFEPLDSNSHCNSNISSINAYTLKNGDFFLSASNCICVNSAWTTEDEGFVAVLFALGTNSGTVLLLEATYDAEDVDALSSVDDESLVQLMLKEQRRTCLTLRHATDIVDNQGKPVAVDSIALAPQNRATLEHVVWRDVLTALQVVVGGRDGSTRLFTVFPFRYMGEAAPASSITPNGELDSKEEGKTEGKGEEEEEDGETGSEAAGFLCKDLWNEQGIFFASSGVTTVTVMRMSEKDPSMGACVNAAVGNDDCLLPICTSKAAAAAAPPTRQVMYIAGDWLGNVYQLQLEWEGEMKQRKGSIKPLTSSGWTAEANLLDALHWSAAMGGAGREARDMQAETLFSQPPERTDEAALARQVRQTTDWRCEKRHITSMFLPRAANPAAALANDEAVKACAGTSESTLPQLPLGLSAAAATTAAGGVPPYELILQKMPAGLDPSQRSEWLQRRQRLLVEALQAQRNAVKARAVLAEYSRDVLLSLGVSLSM
ncbi:telomerase-associated protein [Trypanosoma rangeli]|uniref:Telomerase-associated protein n=1 Tax=Trypanosoma rangeli TaxID=5698 RepID=A0A3R7NVV5_TRYRA|nr:telomerase-associated protein [Trypanosoma rangeli]RNF08543.1 telomerase-associated protein [Trypanosoma rangeli]|eukprot:RNF08543.1 telomerase-associated protein [Trypanosoma rangeli]